MDRISWKEKFQYWLDKKIAKGSSSMIRVLVTATVLFVLAVTVVVFLFHLNDGKGFPSVFWDLFVTTVDEEWPRSGDGKVGHVILYALSAVVGLLFTSVLIGIITSAIEDRIEAMRQGTSRVLESGHVVILGFVPGEYSLISEVVQGFGGRKGTVIVADGMNREEMEELIYANVAVPENVDLICRSVDVQDPNKLRCCSLLRAKAVLISPMENEKVLKAALAAESLLSESPDSPVKVIAAVDSSKYVIQRYMSENRHLIMLQTSDLVARLIAHCSTQPGLSDVYADVFNFEGNEFYEEKIEWSLGRTFGEVVQMARGGSVVGLSNGKGIRLNPDPGTRVRADDMLVYFAENEGSLRLEENYNYPTPVRRQAPEPEGEKHLLIVGYNETLKTILRELPVRRYDVKIVTGRLREAREAIAEIGDRGEITATAEDLDLSDIGALEGAVSTMDYVVLLNDPNLSEDAADIDILLFLFKLYDIRERLQLQFCVTAEMRREKNKGLIFLKTPTDFVIASSISSMIIAQIANNPRMKRLFTELLSNKGNEIYLRLASTLGCAREELAVREMRHRALEYGYLVLGYMKQAGGKREIRLNPDADGRVTLGSGDCLIVLGRK